VFEQIQAIGAKRRDFEFLIGRPPLPKKGKSQAIIRIVPEKR
jgi:hypothetical protein